MNLHIKDTILYSKIDEGTPKYVSWRVKAYIDVDVKTFELKNKSGNQKLLCTTYNL